MGCIGDILTGNPNAPRLRFSFLSAMIALSLATALGSALAPAVYGLTDRSLLHFSYPLSAAWALIAILAVRRCGARGLWTLAGLPFALFWPGTVALICAACKWGHDCI
jgi:hypothetical protein